MGKRQSIRKYCWQTWRATCNSAELEHTLTPCSKINSKWLTDLHVRQGTPKLLEENLGKIFSDISLTKVFSGQSPNRNKSNNQPMGQNHTDKILPSKGNQKETKKTTYRMEASSFKGCN